MLNNIDQIIKILENLSKSYKVDLLTKEEITQGEEYTQNLKKDFEILNNLMEKSQKTFINKPDFINPLLSNLTQTLNDTTNNLYNLHSLSTTMCQRQVQTGNTLEE